MFKKLSVYLKDSTEKSQAPLQEVTINNDTKDKASSKMVINNLTNKPGPCNIAKVVPKILQLC